jgi:hypothetical protein
MSLKPLVKDQTITIDNHHRGTGLPTSWDDTLYDLHIHKRKNKDKRVAADIRIPLNSDRPLQINIKKQKKSFTENQLRKEIQEALGDKNKRQPFINSLIETLTNYPSERSSKERAEEAVKRLAKHFDLSDEIVKEVVSYTHQQVDVYTAVFQDRISPDTFFITLHPKWGKSIIIQGLMFNLPNCKSNPARKDRTG